ncbi:MAG: DNA repair protein RecN [Clostridiales bacterium]|nr:DNA repair protein RecN [Clostridiales bacterium]
MLKSLNISNAAVARNVSIDFDDGFTVITGETGSGKSVMIDCLEIISGAKSSKDIVRSGESKAEVSAVFEFHGEKENSLDNLGAPCDENGEMLVYRSVSADGRGSIKINGKSTTLSQLKEVGAVMLGVNTQDEKNFLTDKREYTAILDSFASNGELLEAYKIKFGELCEAENALKNLRYDLREKNMLVDILSYQIKEIDAAKLTSDDEEERLLKLKTKIKSAERTAKSCKIIYKALSQNEKGYSAAYLLERASAALSQISDIVPNAEDMIRRLDEYRYDIVDIAETVKDALESDIDGDPAAMLDRIESRLSTIDKLKRKYGADIAEIKMFRDESRAKLKKLLDSEEAIEELEEKVESLRNKASSASEELSSSRRNAAKVLSEEIISTLRYLDMPKVRFFIEVRADREDGNYKFTSDGADLIDFKISVNPGEEPQSLSKVASGGEMSRVMLALRSSMNKKSGADTVVFDEIDAGVSGGTSERIGLLLKELSESVQVICITHSPQIASLADHHYLIQKSNVGGRAESSVSLLGDEERVAEIARIIGGINVTDKQRAAAKEMLMQSRAVGATEFEDKKL